MDLINDTSLPALLFRSAYDDDHIAAAVVVRATYRIVGDRLQLADEQVWPVSPMPQDGPQGPMEGDGIFRRGGVDLFLFGHAHSPGGEPAHCCQLAIEIGDWSRRVNVWGRRRWQRRWKGAPRIGAPEPFRTIPLTIDNAFGGTDEWDGLDVPHVDNPVGKGFALTPANAAGRELPHFEDPAEPLERFDQYPPPVGFGFCPATTKQRVDRGMVFDDAGQLVELKPEGFNQAWDGMIAPALHPAEPIIIHGVQAKGPLRIHAPEPPVRVALRLGEQHVDEALQLDQLGIEIDERRAFVTWRHAFRYVIVPEQERCCRLKNTER
ncbi:MAG: DUF2169 domain-containing protein [Planctomycetota bacterium]